MKKIVNHPKGLRLEGVVESDGVGYLPEKEAGPVSFQTSGYFGYIGDYGMLGSRPLDVEACHENDGKYPGRMDAKINSYAKKIMAVAIIAILACIVLMFRISNSVNFHIWFNVLSTVIYLMLIILLMPRAFAILGGRIIRNEDVMNFSKFLGAKNAVENAYYDLGRAPNIGEVKDYSLYSAESKYTGNGYIACLAMLISCVRFLSGWWYWIATILAIVVLCLLEGKNRLTFWQALTVSKPEEAHYMAAMRAMEETADIIDSIQVSYHRVEANPDSENFNEEKCQGCPAYDFCKKTSEELKDEDKEMAEDSNKNPAVDKDC